MLSEIYYHCTNIGMFAIPCVRCCITIQIGLTERTKSYLGNYEENGNKKRYKLTDVQPLAVALASSFARW